MLGPFHNCFDLPNRDLSVIGAEQPDQLKLLILAQVTASGVDLRKEFCLSFNSSSLSSKKYRTTLDRFKLVLSDIFLSKLYVSGDILSLIRYFRFLEYAPRSLDMKPPTILNRLVCSSLMLDYFIFMDQSVKNLV